MKKTCLVILAALSLATAAHARWKPEYASMPAEERAWYDRQQTTPEWRKRVGLNWYNYCCSHADTVEAQFSKQNGHWLYKQEGQDWKAIPDDIVQADVMTPHSKPILFVDATGRDLGPVCFFPGGTGT